MLADRCLVPLLEYGDSPCGTSRFGHMSVISRDEASTVSLLSRYQVMLQAWEEEADRRPTFGQLVNTMGDFLHDSVKQVGDFVWPPIAASRFTLICCLSACGAAADLSAPKLFVGNHHFVLILAITVLIGCRAIPQLGSVTSI